MAAIVNESTDRNLAETVTDGIRGTIVPTRALSTQ
jgi:hypothetical protein